MNIVTALLYIFVLTACISYTVGHFAFYVHFKNFGSGSGGKIINSYNMKPSDNYPLYKKTNKIALISTIVFISSIIVIVILVYIIAKTG